MQSPVIKVKVVPMVKYIALFIMFAAGYLLYYNYPQTHGPGITAKEAPKIERVAWTESISFKGASLAPVKKIRGEVRVIKKKHYYFDELSRYSPLDALVGWKELSDERNLDYLYFTLNNRDYQLDYTKPPVNLSLIAEQTDLWHLIPSNSEVEEQIDKLRNGNIIYLEGILVNISDATNYQFVSATELSNKNRKIGFNIWVEKIHIR